MVKCILRGKTCELGGSKVRDDDDFLVFVGEDFHCSEFHNVHYHNAEQDLENVAGNTEVVEDELLDSKAKDHRGFIINGVEDYGTDYDDDDYDDERYRYTEEELEEVYRTSKVVEDEFDENGRPKLKIVYIHPMDWSAKAFDMIRHYCTEFMDAEMDADFRSRVIFVHQDKDYWPGTESDPDAMARREAKERAFLETGRGIPDYKTVYLDSYDVYHVDEESGWDEDIRGISWREYNRYFNPDLPGYKFLMENIPKCKRMSWKKSADSYSARKQKHPPLIVDSSSFTGAMPKKQRQN